MQSIASEAHRSNGCYDAQNNDGVESGSSSRDASPAVYHLSYGIGSVAWVRKRLTADV